MRGPRWWYARGPRFESRQRLMTFADLGWKKAFWELGLMGMNVIHWHGTVLHNWAIPEKNGTPPKEDMGIPNFFNHFCIGKSQKKSLYFGRKGKEDMGIPKFFNHFCSDTWEFPKKKVKFYLSSLGPLGIPNFFCSFLNSQFFQTQFQDWEFPFF